MSETKYVEVCIGRQLKLNGDQIFSLIENLRVLGFSPGIRFSALYSYQGGDNERCENWEQILPKHECKGEGKGGNGALSGDRLILIGMADRYGIAQWHNLALQEFETMETAERAIAEEWREYMISQRNAAEDLQ
jgi:hypothetical protein